MSRAACDTTVQADDLVSGEERVPWLMVDITLVDGLFVELLAVSKPYLSDSEREEVQQLLNQAEYPAALETFVYIFIDGGKSATQDVFSLITRLTGMLQMQLDDTISKIPRLPPG